VRHFKQQEYQIVTELYEEFGVGELLSYLNLNRSGYYKWLKRRGTLNQYEMNRRDLTPASTT